MSDRPVSSESPPGAPGDRREFLRNLARGGALALLAAGSALLARRARGDACTGAGICGSCPQVGGCARGEAQAYRSSRRSRP